MLLSGCSSDSDVSKAIDDYTPIELSNDERALMGGFGEFEADLFGKANELWDAKGTGNAVMSPLSMTMFMGMIANGCEGEERDEIMSTFRAEGDIAEYNALLAKIASGMKTIDSKVEIELANSLWVREGAGCDKAYTDLIKEYYNADLFTEDFSGATLTKINKWCEEKTHGGIKELPIGLSDIDFTAINATYFRGEWNLPFDTSKTTPENFTNADGTTSKVDMMRGDMHVRYREYEDVELVGIDFYGSHLNFMIYMPKEGHSIAEVASRLHSYSLDRNEKGEAQSGVTDLSMPKFTINGKCEDYTPAFQAMGISGIFEKDYTFPPILSGHAGISGINHCANIKVDEKGTVLEAVTYMPGVLGVVQEKNDAPEKIEINRPFVFEIREASSGRAIAMGRMVRGA